MPLSRHEPFPLLTPSTWVYPLPHQDKILENLPSACSFLPGKDPGSGSPILLILAFVKFFSGGVDKPQTSHYPILGALCSSWHHHFFGVSSWDLACPPPTPDSPTPRTSWLLFACSSGLNFGRQIISLGDLTYRITTCVEKTPCHGPWVLDSFLTQHVSQENPHFFLEQMFFPHPHSHSGTTSHSSHPSLHSRLGYFYTQVRQLESSQDHDAGRIASFHPLDEVTMSSGENQ